MIDLQIEARHMAVTPALKSKIESCAAILNGDIQQLRVTLTLTCEGKAGDLYDVAIIVKACSDIVIAQNHHETADEAIRGAFAVMQNELAALRIPGQSSDRGMVSHLFRDQDFGFIVTDETTEVYFHRNAVQDIDFDALEDGMEVCFQAEAGEFGPQAIAVYPSKVVKPCRRILDDHRPPFAILVNEGAANPQ